MNVSIPQCAAVVRADPEISEIHSNRVFCRHCKEWVALPKHGTEFNLESWLLHRAQQDHAMLAAGLRPPSQHRSGPLMLSEEERADVLNADVDTGAVQRRRVFCCPCAKWICLKKTSHDIVARWLSHKGSIMHMRRVALAPQPPQAPNPSSHGPHNFNSWNPTRQRLERLSASSHNEEYNPSSSHDTLPVNVLSQLPTPTVHDASDYYLNILRSQATAKRYQAVPTLSVVQRFELLSADVDAKHIQEHRVFCRPCAKWVPLHHASKYGVSKWFNHKRLFVHKRQAAVGSESSDYVVDVTLEDGNEALGVVPSLSNDAPHRPPSSNLRPRGVIMPTTRRNKSGKSKATTAPLLQASVDERPLPGDPATQSDGYDAPTILKFIKSYLPPTTQFTKKELEIAALVMQEVAREGAPMVIEEQYIGYV